MPNNRHKYSRARCITAGGILTAMALLCLLGGGFITIGTFVAPICAGVCLLPIAIDIGAKWALLSYAATGLLSLLLVQDIELVLFFIVLLRWYPVFQPVLDKLKHKALRYLLKLLMFNAAVVVVYALLLFLFTAPQIAAELTSQAPWFTLVLLVMANITFLLYDRMLYQVRPFYYHRIKKHLFR